MSTRCPQNCDFRTEEQVLDGRNPLHPSWTRFDPSTGWEGGFAPNAMRGQLVQEDEMSFENRNVGPKMSKNKAPRTGFALSGKSSHTPCIILHPFLASPGPYGSEIQGVPGVWGVYPPYSLYISTSLRSDAKASLLG